MGKIITTIPPKLKQRQKQILSYLYKFHYLNRNQIQTMLKHKKFNRVIIWLNELTENRYIARDFKRKFAGVSSVYCLDIKAKKELEGMKNVNKSLLKRVYRDKKNSAKFKNHCVFLADIYLSLLKLVKQNKAKLSFYTQTDLYKTRYLILTEPDAYFVIVEKSKITKRYFLDIFDSLDSPKWLHKRVMQYFNYFDQEYWQNNTDKPFPEIIMVCPDEEYKKDLERFIKNMFKRTISDIKFYLSTWGEIKSGGMNKQVMHKVETN